MILINVQDEQIQLNTPRNMELLKKGMVKSKFILSCTWLTIQKLPSLRLAVLAV